MSFSGQGNVRYSGQSGPLFKLAIVNSLLTIVTLGIYRFWAKTRIRKYIWSSTSIDGDNFEYTGTGLEKFLGFLIAIVFLAIYLGVIQVVLTFLGLGLTLGEPRSQAEVIAQIASIYISFFAVVPFLLFAVYRARRYKLARTRLRGIRFGMDNAAWGYAFRAIGHYLLTLLTLGILLPRQSFYLEKFMTDRSHYGDAKFEQGGRWQALYGPMKHILFGLLLMIAGGIAGGALGMPLLAGIAVFAGYVWLIVGFVYYRVQCFAYLSNFKTLDGKITFTATPRTGRVMGIVLGGGLLVGLVAAVAFASVGGIVAMSFRGGMTAGGPGMGVLIFAGIAYLGILVSLGALALVWITQPLIAHLAESLTIYNVFALDGVHQRVADKGADAEGFADALDLGGAI